MAKNSKRLVIIDSFALIFRAYYAYPPTLTTKEGEPINAVYGFTSLMLDVLKKFKPSHVIAVFDPQTPILRQTEFVLYKANRKETEDGLKCQIPVVKELLDAFDIPVVRVDGYEADDVIGTIAKKHAAEAGETIIVTGDQDLFQLIADNVSIYLAGRKFSESKLYKHDDVVEKLGIEPHQVPDYKGLAGDASDNIPGVKGVGKKTAVDLIQQFGTVEALYENIDEVKAARAKTALQENYEMAIKSKQLATIETNVPLSFAFDTALFATIKVNKVTEILQELQFKSLFKKFEDLIDAMGLKENMGLFDQESILTTEVKADVINVKDIDFGEAKKIFALFEYENGQQNPLYWSVSDLVFTNDSENFYKVDPIEFEAFFKRILDEKIEVITFDSKKFVHSLLNLQLTTDDLQLFDIGIAAILFGEGIIDYSFESALKQLGQNISFNYFDNVSELKNAYEEAVKGLNDDEKFKTLFELESTILPLVVQMERNGITTAVDLINKFGEQLESAKANLQAEIYEEIGHEFNINSPKQVGEILFVERKLEGGKKTKTGGYSTNEQVLSRLKHEDPIVEKILKYREVEKILSTYIKALPTYVDTDGKIHSIFDQFGAVSGRFASRNPNMQNIPNSDSVGINTRDVFTSGDDSILVAFDYSQQELRILAAIAEEDVMVESFNTGQDIHKLTAAELFGKSIEEVTPAERSIGKTVNFSVIYGISSFGLAERMEIERSIAQTFIDKYYEKYKKVKEFFEGMRKGVAYRGYSETMLGRRRRNPLINSSNRFAKQAAERELLNFKIQGTAADIMKLGMQNIRTVLPKYPAKLLLQVHDEFVFEYVVKPEAGIRKSDGSVDIEKVKEDKQFNEFAKDIKEAMCNVLDLGVEYDVDVKVGCRWGSMTKISN